tara:strand:+ start:2398 stop:3969 length:1572 start_codon:yes stop_codon:yes gene_type:complete
MCGIFAYLSKEKINLEKLRLNGSRCQYRGPDSTIEKYFKINDQYLYFMFHRLAINGLSEKSNQPMCLETLKKYTLICNGEIYNYKELAKKYNIILTTGSDCEIIIHLVNQIGIEDTIKQLDGVFSFVLINEKTKQLIIGHDPIGIRSLYWSSNGETIGISSELKCLNRLDKDIEIFPPGHYCIYDLESNIINLHKYYYFVYKDIIDTEDNIINNIKIKLEKAVDKRLMSDRHIGCLLSGGLDSSIVTAIMAKKLGANNLKTFAIGLEGSPDLLAAQKVADYLGTDHTSIIVTIDEMLEGIKQTIYHIESYDTTTVRASTPMYLLSKYIKEHSDITVIMSGEGSDEASGSYLYFHNAPNAEEFKKETIRLIEDVQYFDVIRCDKTTAAAGLEVRVPFFDKDFINYYMGIDPSLKMIRNGMEKFLLRKAFEDELPKEIVWRRKEGFSDGVSTKTKTWYEIIQDHVETLYDEIPEYQHLQPKLKETLWYRDIFDTYFPNCEKILPYYWMPKWSGDLDDPSGRLIIN